MTIWKYLASLLLASLALSAQAQVIGMATGAQGSLAYNSGQAVARIANEQGMIVRTQPLVGYMPLLQSGEVDFGYANGVEAEFAYLGSGNFDRPHPNLRLVGRMFDLTTGIMAPCDLGLESVADMVGKPELRVASAYIASTIIPYYIDAALATAGLAYQDFRNVPVASFVEGMDALGSQLVDVALVSLNAGAGQQASVRLKKRGGLCYISLENTEAAVAAFKAFLPAGSIATLNQNPNINGLQNGDANLIRIPWMLLTHAEAPEPMVYDLVKAIVENKSALGEAFGAFRSTDFQQMAPTNNTPYHPGAIRYFEEAGIPVGADSN